jgi:hypothetical protein
MYLWLIKESKHVSSSSIVLPILRLITRKLDVFMCVSYYSLSFKCFALPPIFLIFEQA